MNKKIIGGLSLIAFLILLVVGIQTNTTDTFEEVDEALLRVPLPPQPPEPELISDEAVSKQVNTVDTKIYKRDLPGMQTVPSAVENPTTDCTGNTRERFDCYADFITYHTHTTSIEEGFIKVKELYNARDSFAIAQCHQLTHVIGRAAATQFDTVAESYNYGDTFCWSGYYHGIMEAIIAEMGLEQLAARVNDICTTLPGKDNYDFNYFNCVHGLGHGLMYVEAHNLFDALASCDTLNGNWEQESCYGGVYMENVIANEVDHVSEYLKDDDLLYPCNAVGERYKQQCYLMQTSYMLTKVDRDFSEVFTLCAQADSAYVQTCYQSLGRDASGQSTSDPVTTKNICLLGPNETAQEHCVIGAVKDFISYHHSDQQARELCGILPEALRDTCVYTAENYYRSFPTS